MPEFDQGKKGCDANGLPSLPKDALKTCSVRRLHLLHLCHCVIAVIDLRRNIAVTDTCYRPSVCCLACTCCMLEICASVTADISTQGVNLLTSRSMRSDGREYAFVHVCDIE